MQNAPLPPSHLVGWTSAIPAEGCEQGPAPGPSPPGRDSRILARRRLPQVQSLLQRARPDPRARTRDLPAGKGRGVRIGGPRKHQQRHDRKQRAGVRRGSAEGSAPPRTERRSPELFRHPQAPELAPHRPSDPLIARKRSTCMRCILPWGPRESGFAHWWPRCRQALRSPPARGAPLWPARAHRLIIAATTAAALPSILESLPARPGQTKLTLSLVLSSASHSHASPAGRASLTNFPHLASTPTSWDNTWNGERPPDDIEGGTQLVILPWPSHRRGQTQSIPSQEQGTNASLGATRQRRHTCARELAP